jgi:hypothetical protein
MVRGHAPESSKGARFFLAWKAFLDRGRQERPTGRAMTRNGARARVSRRAVAHCGHFFRFAA